MKLLRTIRFDNTDENVFAVAAPDGEAAVTGGFAFAGITAGDLTGKTRQAFANGFLGVPSFGRATFATVADFSEDDQGALESSLAWHLLTDFGAPDLAAAEVAARDEIAFARDLCRDKPVNTVFTIRRVLTDAGDIREEFREIRAPSGEVPHARIWDVTDDPA